MSGVRIRLAVEDPPGEWILRRLLRGHRRLAVEEQVFGLRGDSYLLGQLPIWNRAAGHLPMLVLLDADRACPVERSRLALSDPRHPNLLLRIAVREVEAWILADGDGFAAWAGIPPAKLPPDADAIEDPKQELVNLVRRHGKRAIQREIVPLPGDRRQLLPGYNDAMADFIWRHWDPARAQERSASLRHARQRIAAWRPRLG